MPKKSKFADLFNDLNINETYTKPSKKPKEFTKVRDNVPLIEHYNYMSDILFLPETKEKYKYCLVVVDLANGEFDIEPLRTKEADETKKAILSMFKRSYIKKPYASIQTDGGKEFKGSMDKWMYDESIFHKETVPDRHSQMSVVESLNKQLGRLFNGYMNGVEAKTGKQYNEWTDVIDKVREELNKIRKKNLPKDWTTYDYPDPDFDKESKFKVGDVVYYKLEVPRNMLGHKQSTKNFREGDVRWNIKEPRKIVNVIPYAGKVPYRYMLEGMTNVSYTAEQLMKAPEQEKDTKYEVKEIIGEKTMKKEKYYLVWWKGYKKAEATYEPEKQLIEDGLESYIDEFKAQLKAPKKVAKKKEPPQKETQLRRSKRIANNK